MKRLIHLTLSSDPREGLGHLFGHLSHGHLEPDKDDAFPDGGALDHGTKI